jgi:hypothetical protein
MVLQCGYSAVTVVLQWCYDGLPRSVVVVVDHLVSLAVLAGYA